MIVKEKTVAVDTPAGSKEVKVFDLLDPRDAGVLDIKISVFNMLAGWFFGEYQTFKRSWVAMPAKQPGSCSVVMSIVAYLKKDSSMVFFIECCKPESQGDYFLITKKLHDYINSASMNQHDAGTKSILEHLHDYAF
jgi:hypothetical protein